MSLGVMRRTQAAQQQQQVKTVTVPAPVGGVNARDALSAMPATDAVSMQNWFPTQSYVAIRNGSAIWSSGLNANVETVAGWNGTSASKLFGFAGGNIYDCTVQGAVGAALVTGLNSSRWQRTMFSAGAGNVLMCVDGADAPLRYDGAVQGSLELLTTLVGGTLYSNGTYTNVTLTGGTGTGARASMIVAGGAVTTVTVTTPGAGYVVGDVLGVPGGSFGGAGSGFAITVQTVGGWSVTTLAGTNTITGLALVPQNLVSVTPGHNRLWFIEQNTMNVWYTAVNAYQGTVTLFPLGALFRLGGYLVATAMWTIDNADGINDYTAFITSQGEVAIYQGFDPSTAATWALVGTFRIGLPIGYRCVEKWGSDVVVICVDGLTPLSKALLTDRTVPDVVLTDKIRNAMNDDVLEFGANYGWQIILHPAGTKLLMNVPEASDGTAHQWVMNTQAGTPWTTFTGWNAISFEVQSESLYFGKSGGQVILADTPNSFSDSGVAIALDVQPAFQNFGEEAEKVFQMWRPIFRTSKVIAPAVLFNVDFSQNTISSAPFFSGTRALWNVSPWNTTPWGGFFPYFTQKNWIGATGVGYAASARMAFSVNGISAQWTQSDCLYTLGGPL